MENMETFWVWVALLVMHNKRELLLNYIEKYKFEMRTLRKSIRKALNM